MEVNDELNNITTMLENLEICLAPQGRIAILTFHSIEDRLVKYFFKNQTDLFRPINKKVITATKEEITHNSRAIPAKLRVYEKR